MNAKLGIEIVFLLTALTCAVSLTLYKMPYRRGRRITPLKCLVIGIFLADVFLFLPVYSAGCDGFEENFDAVLLSIHNSLRLFVLDGEFDIVSDYAALQAHDICMSYKTLGAVLYVLSPLFTFSIVMSFFREAAAVRQTVFHYFQDIYVFSELNEEALALAGSLKKAHKKSLIVFTDVFGGDDEETYELQERAKELKPAFFKKDIADLSWAMRSKSHETFFFLLGKDDDENLTQGIRLLQEYKNNERMHLYLFSSSAESEIIFRAVEGCRMRVRRVDPIRSLVYRNLYENGARLFECAKQTDDGPKVISAVIVGAGLYGTEMLKALTWFCQMDGYRLSVDVFEKDAAAESKFTALCPELMKPDKNGALQTDDAIYQIVFHQGVDVASFEFAKQIKKLTDATYVFVALGSDAQNIKTAMNLRTLFEQISAKPDIQTVVYNSEKAGALSAITDYRGNPYNIKFVGDYKTAYAEKTIIDSELDRAALMRHMKWGKEADFWSYEYNYRSSVATAIHMKMRIICGIMGADKCEADLNLEEKKTIEILEHRRWSAYMRSEGWNYSGSTDKKTRNDLGKLHHDLVPFSELPKEERKKDSQVGTE